MLTLDKRKMFQFHMGKIFTCGFSHVQVSCIIRFHMFYIYSLHVIHMWLMFVHMLKNVTGSQAY